MSYIDKEKRVEYGLENVHVAIQTVGPEMTVTNGKPEAVLGATHLVLNPVGEKSEVYADNCVWYDEEANQGFDGELELSRLTDEFRIKYLGEVKTKDGTIYEVENPDKPQLLLMFEIKNDKGGNRYLVHGVKFGRPTIETKTNEKGKSYKVTKLPFRAIPVKIASGARVTKGVVCANETIYSNLFTTPYVMPTDLTQSLPA